MNVHELAQQLRNEFHVGKRPEAVGSRYVFLNREAPPWMHDVVQEAHGMGMLPDDWCYETIREALDFIIENGGDLEDLENWEDCTHEFSDSGVDIYVGDLTAWLHSHPQRIGFVDQAKALVGASEDTVRALRQGQYLERGFIFSRLLWALERREETSEEATEESVTDET